MALDFRGHFLYSKQVRRRKTVFKQSPEYRWYNAYQAYRRAQNPQWKEFWLSVMDHLRAQFN